MIGFSLRCSQCAGEVPPDSAAWSCPLCGGALELVREPSAMGREALTALRAAISSSSGSTGVWRYAAFLPVDPALAVSLGEVETPVVSLPRLGRSVGIPKLYAKLEYLNPTGSFKDRGTTVMVTRARQLGVTRLVEDSSGNAGASFAAYCARAAIRASIYVPSSAPPAKKSQVALYGAEVVEIEGSRDSVTEAAVERCRRDGAYYASHNWNPFFLEGTKSFAYEVASRFTFDLPENVVMPVGNGSLFLGAWKGFGELVQMGAIDRRPKMHVAQATGCMPLADGYLRGLEQPEPIPVSPTVAGGISIAHPSRGREILRTLRESGGGASAVPDEEILRYQRLLASEEGIFCEPTSAAAFAVLRQLVRSGALNPEERVLVAVTGIGLKDPDVLLRG